MRLRLRAARSAKVETMTERPTALSFVKAEATSPPFDSARLDALLDEAGIEALVISSKHNIQYLFGGYRFFFFDHFDAIGVSRYLPLLVYVKGRPDESTYIGHAMESYEKDLGKFWTPAFQTARATLDSAQLAVDHLTKLGSKVKRVGVEARVLAGRCGGTHGSRGSGGDGRRRALAPPTPAGPRPRRAGFAARRLRTGGRFYADGDRLTWAGRDENGTREALRREEMNRGLTFEYCLIAAGTSLNRAPTQSSSWRMGWASSAMR